MLESRRAVADRLPRRLDELLKGVLQSAQVALPKSLDALVWGASYNGDQDTVRYLLAIGGGLSWEPPEDGLGAESAGGCSCLSMASRLGHERLVDLLLRSGADVGRARARDGQNALHAAAKMGHAGIASRLARAGADVNKATTDISEVTPLMIAAAEGHADVAAVLLQCGADVNKGTPFNGVNPLSTAAAFGHAEVVKQLLQAGADLDRATTDALNATPLLLATMAGHADVVDALLLSGADVNSTEGFGGGAALSFAAEFGFLAIAKQLLAAGADPGHKDKMGDTALRHAVRAGHRELSILLMKRGGPDWKDGFGPGEVRMLIGWVEESVAEKEADISNKGKQIKALISQVPDLCAKAASPPPPQLKRQRPICRAAEIE